MIQETGLNYANYHASMDRLSALQNNYLDLQEQIDNEGPLATLELLALGLLGRGAYEKARLLKREIGKLQDLTLEEKQLWQWELEKHSGIYPLKPNGFDDLTYLKGYGREPDRFQFYYSVDGINLKTSYPAGTLLAARTRKEGDINFVSLKGNGAPPILLVPKGSVLSITAPNPQGLVESYTCIPTQTYPQRILNLCRR